VVGSGKNDVAKIGDMAPERFLDVMDANVTQSWLMARAAGKQMLAQGKDGKTSGKIVLMSSARGLLGHPAGYTAYCAHRNRPSTASPRRSAANGATTGITVNAIAPTVFRSPPHRLDVSRTPRRRKERAGRIPRPGAEGPARRAVRTLRGPSSSSPRRRPTSTPGISSTPTAAIRQDDTCLARERIAVIGAGLMGHGIAQVFAVAGHDVAVHDAQAGALDGLRSRIAANLDNLDLPRGPEERVTGFADVAECVADAAIVIEAAPEKLALKQAIFADLVRYAPRHAILASNTSVIPITDIAGDLDTADRILGTHWWNPPFLVPLVEVVGTARTAPQNIEAMIALLTSVGKTPVHVRKDVAGFVGNRLQHAPLARGDRNRRRGHRRCPHGRYGGQGKFRPSARRAGTDRERRPRRHGPYTRYPHCRASAPEPRRRTVSLSSRARRGRSSGYEIRGGISNLDG
jgi:NAD(P)-dependent dehydrogenase (short-subunit alcohol dehydrogenase family)